MLWHPVCSCFKTALSSSRLLASRDQSSSDLVHGPQNILNATGAAGSCRPPTFHFDQSNQPNKQKGGEQNQTEVRSYGVGRLAGAESGGRSVGWRGRLSRPTGCCIVVIYLLFVAGGGHRSGGVCIRACALVGLPTYSLVPLFSLPASAHARPPPIRRCECRVIRLSRRLRHGSE